MSNPTCMLCRQPGHTPINCPNKKTSVTKTKSAAADATQIQPIESLSPYIGNRWVIRARVIDKSPVRTWSNARSQGKLFSMTLIDDSGPIRCTIFQEGVDKYYDMLEDGKVFHFSKGQIKNANKKYSSVNCEYELSLDKEAEIWPLRGNDPAAETLPQQSYNFVPVEALKVKEKGSMVDVLGVLAHAGQPQAITSKAGNSLTKRSIMIADQTAQVEITVWDSLAENWSIAEGTVLGVKAARTTEFQGEIGLALSASSVIDQDIAGSQPQALMKWYQSIEGKINVPNISRGNAGGASKGPILYRNTLEEIQRLALGKGEKPDYISVRGTIVHIKSDNLMYDSCATCNKKLIPINFNSGPYRCEKCDQQFDTAEKRYMLSMMISDGTTQVWVTAFDETAQQIFGITANEMSKQGEEDPSSVTALCSKRMYSQIIARLRVKEDRYGDGEERTRMSLVAPVRWIGTPADDNAPASTFQYECEVMQKEIDAFFA